MVTNQKTKLIYGVLGITAIIVFGIFGYWLKSQMGISFSEKYSLSKYFPFSYFSPRKVICDPAPGILLEDSFDSFSLFGNWTPLWMREKGKVNKSYVASGIDNSRCLFIKSISTKSWACSYKKMIRVREGDVFSYKAFAKLLGDSPIASTSIVTFDKDERVISWNDFSKQTDTVDEWVPLEKTFTIPEGVTYIRLRVSGTGIGEFRFDDISFSIPPLVSSE